MTLLPLRVTQPFRDYKHGDLIDTEEDVIQALEHHPHFVVQVPGDVKSAAAAEAAGPAPDPEEPKAPAKTRPAAR